MNSLQPGDEEGSYGGEDADGSPSNKKSERKRRREKDRRKEMAEGFVELGQLLAQVDPDDSENGRGKGGRRGSDDGGSADADSSGMTRIDLISRAIDTIRRLHTENSELKRRKGAIDDKEALLMAPTLQPLPGVSGTKASAGGTSTGHPRYPHPYYQPPQPISMDPRRGHPAYSYPQMNGAQNQHTHHVYGYPPPNTYGYPPPPFGVNAGSRGDTSHSQSGVAQQSHHAYRPYGMYPPSYSPQSYQQPGSGGGNSQQPDDSPQGGDTPA